ncbi:MAG: hypothetical protein ABI304_00650 [Rudaea sp.]
MKTIAHFSLLLATAIALFGAAIHWIAPLLGPDWYAFLHAPAAAVASARNGTAFGPSGAIVIGALMFACALFGLSARGDLRYLPFTRAALVVISFICLVRGLIVIPYIIILPRVPPFELVASLIWFVAGVGFFVGLVGTWPVLSQKARHAHSVGGS